MPVLLVVVQRQSEIGHVGLARPVEQDVGGLQVAMHKALLMSEPDRFGDLEHQIHDPLDAQRFDRAYLSRS
jgi:hypothetical protein